MAKPQEKALAGAIRSEDDGARTCFEQQADAIDEGLAAGDEADLGEPQREDRHAAPRFAVSPTRNAAALTSAASAMRTSPSPRASGRSPRLVSSAIAVVIVRVTPAILPP